MDELGQSTPDYLNMWTEHTSFSNDSSPLTALEYDNCFDVLWMAHANGRLSSYSFSDEVQYLESLTEENGYMPTAPTIFPYSSFPVTSDGISQILPNQNTIVSVGCSKIRMTTHGGGGLGSWSINHCPNPSIMNNNMTMLSPSEMFTCADLIRDPTISRTSSAYLASSLIAGTSSAGAYLFDLGSNLDTPIMVYNVFQPTVKIVSNGQLIVVAGQDGNIRILDGKFRSTEVNKMVEAHTGSIRDVCMQSDGRTLITCGTSKRAINPYDPKSPFHYSNDVQIRVFDLRMHRMLAPLQVVTPANTSSGVGYIRLIPQVDTSPVEFGSLLMCTDDGIVQVSDLTVADPLLDDSSTQLLYAPLQAAHDLVTSVAVSSSGQFLAVGTSSGVLGQYSKVSGAALEAFHSSDGMKSTELFRVNEMSPHAKVSPASATPAKPLLSLSVDNPVLGTAYALCAPHHTPAMLSSSFAMTPSFVKRKLRLVPTSRVSEELLQKTSSRQEFIRIIPNPGYRPNSMKNLPKVTPTVTSAGVSIRPPYAVCDPRKVQILQQHAAQQQAGGGGGGSSGKHHLSRSNSHNADLNSLSDSAEAASGNEAALPRAYMKCSSSNMSKQRFKKFNYASVNDTPFVGLENNVPNSLINPILQLCYALVPLRDQALLSQLNVFHYQEAHQGTVVCELGFLFHMIRLVEEYSQSTVPGTEVDRVVRAANFQRVFQTLQLIPEAVALSLFDESVQSDLQQFIQKFVPFLLRLLLKEVDSENAYKVPKTRNAAPPRTANVIDELFGYSILPSTTFLHSGVYKVDPKQHRAMVLDLIYPSLTAPQGVSGTKKPNSLSTKAALSPTPASAAAAAAVAALPKYKITGKKDRVNASFSAVLWGSFQREISMKGWCAESDSYEPFKKVQSLTSLPKILTLLCGNTSSDVKDSTTLAGAMGETIGQGSTHSNYWSHPLLVTAPPSDAAAATSSDSPSKIAAQRDPLLQVRPGESREFAWLPVECEVAFRTRNDTEQRSPGRPGASLNIDTSAPDTRAVSSKLVVSCRCVPFDKNSSEGNNSSSELSVWIIYDGSSEILSGQPASLCPALFDFTDSGAAGQGSGDWVVRRFRLMSLVLQVTPPPPAPLSFGVPVIVSTSGASDKKHLVLQLNKAPAEQIGAADWHLFNDFVVQKIPMQEVVTFPVWKHPCMVCFEACGTNEPPTASPAGTGPLSKDRLVVPASVLQLESLSRIPSIRLLQSFATLPGPGDLIAFDGEFVSVSLEKSIINGAGERVVSEEVRQVLARISLLDMGHGPRDTEDSPGPASPNTSSSSSNAVVGSAPADGPGATVFNKNMMRIIADDYILPVEPVLDYVTRFSGITEEDLNPSTSKHSILTQRAAYLKLRYFIDAKCVFVGHGLQKDFETANIFVPPEQIRDTVELWRLPNQRKISLRFLASYILKEDIQDEIHDSIEDAKTSLLLYKRYKALAAEGPDRVNAVLQDLYMYGNRNNWTIGVDKLVR